MSYTLEPGGVVNLELGKYYHLYNRSNNEEIVFRADENYVYFLKKYRSYLQHFVNTIAYCLMPTHFHFVVRVTTTDESLPDKDFYRKYFKSEVEFKKYSEKIVAGIKIQDTLKVPYILILLSFFSGYISP